MLSEAFAERRAMSDLGEQSPHLADETEAREASSNLADVEHVEIVDDGWRFRAAFVSALVLGFCLWPLSWGPDEDSFPVSSFPMFSHGRPSPMLTIRHAVGIRADGTREPLSPMLSAGNREVLQSMMTIVQGVDHDASAFCAEVAGRVLEAGEDYERVELSTETWDTVRYFAESAESVERVVHAECSVQPESQRAR